MALPPNGAISMSQIKSELSSASNSLRQYSNTAGKTTPDSMSEFYGYSGCNEYTITSTDPNFGVSYQYRECGTNELVEVIDFFGTINVCSTIVPVTIGGTADYVGEC
jgi:hypothetical protein